MAGLSSKTNIDMLNGPLGRKILRFAIPIALSSIFQQMFNLADVAVVGQFAGDKALAAVGANTFVINLLINLFVGLSVGANVVVANSIGERSYRSVTRSVHTSVMVAFFSGIFLSFVGIFFARPILELISTPADVLDMAVRYLQIYFAGMPFVMVYNFVSAVLRSKGDTKRPLYVLMVAGAVNVVLNLILVAGFDMGVSGVAIATVIANVISGVTLFYLLLHEVGPFKLEFWKLRVTPFFLSRILRVGIPTGLRGVVFSFSNVCLQSAINSLGSATVAASAVALNYEFVVYYWLSSFSQACVTFVGQNYGAKNMERCRRTVRWTLLLGCSSTIVLSALCCIFAKPMLSVFTSNAEIIEIGSIRMYVVVGLLAINVFLDVFSGALSGMGKSLAPALTCMVGVCGIRILWVIFVFPKYKSFASLMVVYPISWILTISVIMGIYFYQVKRTKF
jgi:putative MATE family efflux protein